jgi:MYND finger
MVSGETQCHTVLILLSKPWLMLGVRRLAVGLCDNDKPQRKRSRDYLMKAAYATTSSDNVKAIAHSLLIQWYIDAYPVIPLRYVFVASHHCNTAAQLCARVYPGAEVPASASVLLFVNSRLKELSETLIELKIWCRDGLQAREKRMAQMSEGTEKMAKKRLENPLRYICATPGCFIQTDTGTMFSRCTFCVSRTSSCPHESDLYLTGGGPCDLDKKPSYCSKKCQKADWKNHKPFCQPGAECSVIDDGKYGRLAASAPSHKSSTGARQVPMKTPDGRTIMLSSSTMDLEMMKELSTKWA